MRVRAVGVELNFLAEVRERGGGGERLVARGGGAAGEGRWEGERVRSRRGHVRV
jgi:hypothetical protein